MPQHNSKLCLMGRFLTEKMINFQEMKQTLAALWSPVKGVWLKEVTSNLYSFKFHCEEDVARVKRGEPWTFNRQLLLLWHMEEGMNPATMQISEVNLWIQIFDILVGFCPIKVNKEVGNIMVTVTLKARLSKKPWQLAGASPESRPSLRSTIRRQKTPKNSIRRGIQVFNILFSLQLV